MCLRKCCNWLWLMIGPDHSVGLIGIAVLQVPDPLCEPIEKIIIQAFVDDQAVYGHADLPLMEELSEDGCLRRLVEVGVAQNDERRVPAEFELEAFHDRAFDRLTRDASSDGRGAGERDYARRLMDDEGVANLAAGPDEDAHDARRQVGLFEHFCQEEPAGNGRVAGRLHYHGIAHGQSGPERTGGQMERPIPGADEADHAHGLTIHPALLAGNVPGEDAAFHEVWHGSSFQHDCVRGLPFEARLDPGAAGLSNQPADDLLAARFHDGGDPAQHGRALPGQLGRPMRARRLGRLGRQRRGPACRPRGFRPGSLP